MKKKLTENTISKTISFNDNSVLQQMYGEHDKFLKIIESNMHVSIITRGNFLKISGDTYSVSLTIELFDTLFENVKKNNSLEEGEVLGMINLYKDSEHHTSKKIANIDSVSFTAGKKLIKPRSKQQIEYFNLVGLFISMCIKGF